MIEPPASDADFAVCHDICERHGAAIADRVRGARAAPPRSGTNASPTITKGHAP